MRDEETSSQRQKDLDHVRTSTRSSFRRDDYEAEIQMGPLSASSEIKAGSDV